MVNEKVSIIIALDGRREQLQTAVQSVLNQSYDNWELIVVDEQPSELHDPIKNLHQNINVVRQPFRGTAAARNAGIGSATGDFISFLDADDTWMPEKLTAQIEEFRRTLDVALCFTGFNVSGVAQGEANGTAISKTFDQTFDTELVDVETAKTKIYRPKGANRDVSALVFVEEHCIPISTVMIRRSCLPYTGLFDPMLENGATCDMWVKILRRFFAAQVVGSLVTCLARPSNTKSLLDGNTFDHAEIYSKYIQYGAATSNRELVSFASALLSSSNHAVRCHRFA